MKQSPDFSIENQHAGIICGVDEAGRGPWAGPVIAAAVIWPNQESVIDGLDDSKKLSSKKRKQLFDQILDNAQVGIGQSDIDEIDQFNILNATKLAMLRAISALPIQPTIALIDGNQPPTHDYVQTISMVKGDSKSLSIAAASIIAKVTRDHIMSELAITHHMYGWERNAGYGTKQHQQAIAQHGITTHHRKSFAPIRKHLEENAA